MPIPLAHPSVVLPLRRYCPRWLSLPALVIGSMAPDAGYLFDDPGLGGLSHEFFGSIAFAVPVGILSLAILFGLRKRVVALLPEPQRQTYEPLCRRPLGPIWIIALSLVIGIWSHVIWDSFVHVDGWVVERLPLLQTPVIQYSGRTARVSHVLWYGSSFAGVVAVFLALENWKRGTSPSVAFDKAMLRDAFVVALLIMPISLIHHIFNDGFIGIALTAALCALLVLKFVFGR
jgi:hypothetical protein